MTQASKNEESKKTNTVLLRMNNFGPFLKKEEVDKLFSDPNNPKNIFLKELLESFFDRPFSHINEEVLIRYLEITTEETYANFTPGYKNIVERVVDPLISAKKYYCLGEYLSCVALSGIISEMLTLLIWKMSTFKIEGQKINNEQEEKFFGKNFEKISQERRENILIAIKAIDEKLYKQFKEIRTIRNRYMHSWEYDTRQQKGDAKKVIGCAFKLYKVIASMNLVIKEGKQVISINPRLLAYLKSSNKQ